MSVDVGAGAEGAWRKSVTVTASNGLPETAGPVSDSRLVVF